MNRVLFKSATDEWSTPQDVYDSLDKEFGFKDDPCPMGGGLGRSLSPLEISCLLQPTLLTDSTLGEESL